MSSVTVNPAPAQEVARGDDTPVTSSISHIPYSTTEVHTQPSGRRTSGDANVNATSAKPGNSVSSENRRGSTANRTSRAASTDKQRFAALKTPLQKSLDLIQDLLNASDTSATQREKLSTLLQLLTSQQELNEIDYSTIVRHQRHRTQSLSTVPDRYRTATGTDRGTSEESRGEDRRARSQRGRRGFFRWFRACGSDAVDTVAVPQKVSESASTAPVEAIVPATATNPGALNASGETVPVDVGVSARFVASAQAPDAEDDENDDALDLDDDTRQWLASELQSQKAKFAHKAPLSRSIAPFDSFTVRNGQVTTKNNLAALDIETTLRRTGSSLRKHTSFNYSAAHAVSPRSSQRYESSTVESPSYRRSVEAVPIPGVVESRSVEGGDGVVNRSVIRATSGYDLSKNSSPSSNGSSLLSSPPPIQALSASSRTGSRTMLPVTIEEDAVAADHEDPADALPLGSLPPEAYQTGSTASRVDSMAEAAVVVQEEKVDGETPHESDNRIELPADAIQVATQEGENTDVSSSDDSSSEDGSHESPGTRLAAKVTGCVDVPPDDSSSFYQNPRGLAAVTSATDLNASSENYFRKRVTALTKLRSGSAKADKNSGAFFPRPVMDSGPVRRTVSAISSQEEGRVLTGRSTSHYSLAGADHTRMARKVMSSSSLGSSRPASTMSGGGVPTPSPEEESVASIAERLRIVTQWEFDVFDFCGRCEDRPLAFISFELYSRLAIFDDLQVPDNIFTAFVNKVERDYCFDPSHPNPYHTNVHAADVVQAIGHFLVVPRIARILDQYNAFSIITAAVIHDFRHPGVNNTFLIKTGHNIALRYNDESVLENFHAAEGFAIMHQPKYNLMVNFSPEQKLACRFSIIKSVLATDLAQGQKYVNAFKAKSGVTTLGESDEDRLLILQMMIKCADVSHPARQWKVHEKWSHLVTEEFYRQGDQERMRGIPISPLCDRSAHNLPKSQLGFITYVVAPAFQSFSDFCGVDTWLTQLADNEARWLELSAAGATSSTMPVSQAKTPTSAEEDESRSQLAESTELSPTSKPEM